jgi:hypothetical protein
MFVGHRLIIDIWTVPYWPYALPIILTLACSKNSVRNRNIQNQCILNLCVELGSLGQKHDLHPVEASMM